MLLISVSVFGIHGEFFQGIRWLGNEFPDSGHGATIQWSILMMMVVVVVVAIPVNDDDQHRAGEEEKKKKEE